MTNSKENVVIAAGDCSVTLMPEFGGKIATITAYGHQLLQPPLMDYSERTHETPFDQSDASGWDECLPSVGACTVHTPAGPAHIPDHGDLWRIPWDLVSHTPDSVTLRAQCFSLPLELTRSISVREITTGWQLCLEYTLVNRGSHAIPWSWAAHSLFSVEPGDSLHLPEEIQTLRLEGSGNNRLGSSGDIITWPIAKLPAGSSPEDERDDQKGIQKTDDLRIVKPAITAIGDKLFAGPITDPASGWCIIERPSVGLRITIRFSVTHTPYLGLWICYGGWPDRPGPKQTCVALEPATAPVDSLAQTGPWSRSLAPGASFSWPMNIELQSI